MITSCTVEKFNLNLSELRYLCEVIMKDRLINMTEMKRIDYNQNTLLKLLQTQRMSKIATKKVEYQIHNPEQQTTPQNKQQRSSLKEQKLNAELLRIKSQYLQKTIEKAWKISQQQLIEFFNSFGSIWQMFKMSQLMNRQNTKLVRTEQKIFMGQIRNKKKHGQGITIYRSGRMYEGEYEDNEKEGKGYQIYQNGNLYVGEYHQNKKHGRGTFFWFTLCEHIATKQAGQKVQQYQGLWWGGLPDGEGQHQKCNGDFYLGQFKNGLKHGQGIEYYSNGDTYKGEFVNGLPQGFGQYTWKDNSIYKGDFKQGYRNGYGVWNDCLPSSQHYKGHYMLDKKHGFGIYDWANGYHYKGNFLEDQRSGEGKLYFNEDLVYDGFWMNGQKCEEEYYQRKQTYSKQHKALFSGSKSDKTLRKVSRSLKHGQRHKKTDDSFVVNFNAVQPRHCARGCVACKSKQKKRLKILSKTRK